MCVLPRSQRPSFIDKKVLRSFSCVFYCGNAEKAQNGRQFSVDGNICATQKKETEEMGNICDPCTLGLDSTIPLLSENVNPHFSIEEIAGILRSCRRQKNKKHVTGFCYYLHASGLESQRYVGNQLVSMLVDVGDLCDAQRLFDKLTCQFECSWNSLITGYSKRGMLIHAFNLVQRVEHDVTLDLTRETCAALLIACTKVQDLSKGLEMHSTFLRIRFLERDPVVGCMMIDMFVKCGALDMAQEVLDKLPIRDVVSWTALIGGYVHHGESEQALACFERMGNDGVSPNAVTFSCIVKACGEKNDIEKGMEVHCQIEKKSLSKKHVIVGNALVHMYANFGFLPEAQKVFNSLPDLDVVSWTAIISAYVRWGDSVKALKFFEQMRLQNASPNVVTYIWSLKACVCAVAIEQGMKIHMDIEKKGLGNENLLINILLDMYAKHGMLLTAQTMFNKLEIRGVVSWTAIIAGYTDHGKFMEAIKCFEQMQVEGVIPDVITLNHYLKSCGNAKAVSRCENLHAKIEETELIKQDGSIRNKLIEVYCLQGMFAEACQIMDNLLYRTVIDFTALMTGYLDHGYFRDAFNFFEQMQLEGASPDSSVFVCGIKACGGLKAGDKCYEIHSEIEKKGWVQNEHVGNSLTDMYVKCGLVVAAQHVFDRLKIKDVVSWSTLISGYVEHGYHHKALRYFELMQKHGVSPNVITFVYVLKACKIGLDIVKAYEIHSDLEKMGLFERNLEIGTALVDMYAKVGFFFEANTMFQILMNPDTVLWTALISGYIQHGHGEKAIQCLEQMQQMGIPFNSVTYICSLKACSAPSEVDNGLKMHAEIERMGLLINDAIMGNTLVDMYAKCGYPSRAQEVFDKLFIQEVTTWNCLIMGYINHDCYEEALYCYEKMRIECVIPDTATYIYSLKASEMLGMLNKCLEIHAITEGTGLLQADNILGNTLINAYGKFGIPFKVQEVFDILLSRDIVSWNVLMAAYIEHDLNMEALKCLTQMELEGICPDSVTYLHSLKACGNSRCVGIARKLHAKVNRTIVFGKDAFIGTAVANMYAKCGLLSEVHQVFHALPFQNTATWNSLIVRYGDHGNFQEAFEYFQQMQLHGFLPNAITLSCCLKTCGNMRAIDKGWEIHSEIERKGLLRTDLVVGNGLVDMYAKCGSIMMAQQVFNLLPVRDAVSWTTLMSGYAEHGCLEEALQCFQHMQLEGIYPNAVTFLLSLRVCSSMRFEPRCLEMPNTIATIDNLQQNLVIGNILVAMYAKSGELEIAQQTFNKLPVQDINTWTVLITGLVEYGKSNEALQCVKRMRLHGLFLNIATLLCCLKACGIVGAFDKGQELHVEIEALGLTGKDIVMGAALIDMYGKCGSINQSQEVFDKIPGKDVVVWNSLIGGYASYGHGKKALECFKEMQQESLSPSPVTFVCCLKACGSIGAEDTGHELHDEIEKKGLLETDIFIGNILVDMYAKCGSLVVAEEITKRLPVRNVITWNSLITGYAQLGETENAFHTLNKMIQGGVRPDCVSFLIILSACSRIRFFDANQMYFETMSKEFGIATTRELHNGMISLLCRAGQLDMAISMARELPFCANLVAWHSILDACRSCGNIEFGKQAFQCALFSEIRGSH